MRDSPFTSTSDRALPMQNRHTSRARLTRQVFAGSRSLLAVGLVVLLVIITSGCTQRVSGYTNPDPASAAPIEWRPLNSVIEAAFIVGPEYRGVIAENPETIPTVGDVDRVRTAQRGELDEIQVGLRADPNGDLSGSWETGAEVQISFSPEDDPRFPEGDFHAWPADTYWLPESNGGVIAAQTFVSPYPELNGVLIRIATFGGDLSAGEAIVGASGAEVRDQPVDGDVTATLDAGQRVTVVNALEGSAVVRFGDGTEGYVSLDSFSRLPAPHRRVRHPLNFTLRDSKGEVVREVEIPVDRLHDNFHLPITFDPIQGSKDQMYTFALSMDTNDEPAGMTVRATTGNAYRGGALHSDDSQDLVFRPLYGELEPLYVAEIDSLARDGDWVIIQNPPDVEPGKVIELRLIPGNGSDASTLEYGFVAEGVTEGAWFTMEDGAPMPGGILLRTHYERDVVAPLAIEVIHRLRTTINQDLMFLVAYASALSVLLVSAIYLTVVRPKRSQDAETDASESSNA